MRNILLVGGMGTGKTTLAEKLCESDNSIFHLEGSKYGVKIPMTLGINPSNLSKGIYIETVINSEDIPLREDLTREMTDRYFAKLHMTYGNNFFGELYEAVISEKGRFSVIDNCPIASNIKYLKDRDFYVVGLVTDFETQVKRCMERRKGIDPINESDMRIQVMDTAKNFELVKCMNLADCVFDMNKYNIKNNADDARYIVSEILKRVF